MTARPGSDYPNGAVTGAVNVLRVAFLRRFRNGVPVSASSLRQAGTGEPCEAARAPFPPPLAPTSPRHPFASWRRSGGVSDPMGGGDPMGVCDGDFAKRGEGVSPKCF